MIRRQDVLENKYLFIAKIMVFPAIHFKIIKIPFTTSRNTINPVRKTICKIMEPSYYQLQLQIYSKIFI